MPLSKDNLATTLNLLNAHVQRQETVRQIVAQLNTGAIWRSTDGEHAVPIPPAEVTELENFVKLYLDEANLIAVNLRAMMEKKS